MVCWGPRDLPKQVCAARTRWLALLCSVICSVCFAQAPINDHFTNAIVLEGNSAIFSGSLTNATFELGESSVGCGGHDFGGGSVWWSWTATNSTPVVVNVLASAGSPDAGMIVHTGKDVTLLTEIDCIFLGSMTNGYLRFAANAGTTYYIRAWGREHSFTLRLTATNAPVIFQPPQDKTVAETTSVMFGVIAGGFLPLKYQWQFAGNALPGQTAPSLVLHYLAPSQAGGYSVVVSNSSGVSTSAVATLTISPTSPPLLLAPVAPPDTKHFSFSLAGETGHFYRIWATTNLTNWIDEPSLAFDPSYPTLVVNANPTSVYSIPIDSEKMFLRASRFMPKEICMAQLQAINHAIRLFAIETRHGISDPLVEQDLTPFLKNPVVCPWGGTTFADSYTITDVASPPTCQRFPQTHKLPP